MASKFCKTIFSLRYVEHPGREILIVIEDDEDSARDRAVMMTTNEDWDDATKTECRREGTCRGSRTPNVICHQRPHAPTV